MYSPNYESLAPYLGAYYQNSTITVHPFGKCLLITNYSNPLLIQTKTSIEIFLTDTYQDTYFNLARKSFTGDKVEVHLSPYITSEYVTYNIKVSQHQQLEYKGLCQNYETLQEYDDCQLAEYKRILKVCVPKWVDNQTSCEKLSLTDDMKDFKSALENLTIDLTGGNSLSVPGCKPHCLKTMIESNQLVYRKNVGKYKC